MLGERLQRDLCCILMGFQKHLIAISVHIKIMYRMFKMDSAQWNLQRIYCRECTDDQLIEYWLIVVVHKMIVCKHNLVTATMYQRPKNTSLGKLGQYERNSTQVTAPQWLTAKEMNIILRDAGFELQKWGSNSRSLEGIMKMREKNTMMIEDDSRAAVCCMIQMDGSLR